MINENDNVNGIKKENFVSERFFYRTAEETIFVSELCTCKKTEMLNFDLKVLF